MLVGEDYDDEDYLACQLAGSLPCWRAASLGGELVS